MKRKYFYLILLNVALTVLTQLIFNYPATSDTALFIRLAELYRHGVFFDVVGNYYGHQFYGLFLLLAGGWMSYNAWIIILVQTVIFSLSAIFLARQLEKYWNRDLTGLILFLFLIPEVHFFNGTLVTESLAMSMLLLCFGLAVKIYNEGITAARLLFISLFTGLLLMTRAECAVVIVPVFYFLYPAIKKTLLKNSILLISVPAWFVLLTGFLNYETFHQFRMTSFHGAEVVYGGNNKNLDGSFHVFEKHKEIFIPADRIAVLDSIEALPEDIAYPARSAFYMMLAKEAWQKNPAAQLEAIPDKFAKNWLLPGFFDIYTRDTSQAQGLQLGKILSAQYFHNAWYAPYKHLFYMLIHWFLLLLIGVGLFRIKTKDRFQKAVLAALIIFLFYAVPFCALPRWHVPLFPVLIIAFTPALLTEKLNKIFSRPVKKQ